MRYTQCPLCNGEGGKVVTCEVKSAAPNMNLSRAAFQNCFLCDGTGGIDMKMTLKEAKSKMPKELRLWKNEYGYQVRWRNCKNKSEHGYEESNPYDALITAIQEAKNGISCCETKKE